jgi:1-deoxy-D-xylulose-5-phosphate synthase
MELLMNGGNILDKIGGPEDLKLLNKTETEILCAELRRNLIDTISINGGHLASNLGVVELTVALHKVFNSPEDQIVWDVGHQSYVHKLLTGRKDKFATIRAFGGISGFTKPLESAHDPYGAGHGSTSISAACGLAAAKSLRNEAGSVIAVIGDGALTGGLAYEGMNNAGRTHNKLIVVLNDNKMSISKNVGGIARHLAIIRAKPWYFKVKDSIETILLHIPFFGSIIRNALIASKSAIKNTLYHSTIFEEMGFVYLGPVDGHNIDDVSRLLERAKAIKRPAFVHVMTVKGKGYTYAEQDPKAFHGVSCFDIETGDPVSCTGGLSFSDVFGKMICKMAESNDKICAITAAMSSGTGLTEFSSRFHNRFFDVGIAEEHGAVFAAGLAKNGMLPVFAVYSTFLQRSYDQIIHDIALQGLKVVFAVDRAGIIGEDGETHQGIFDAAFLNSIPGITVFSPTTGDELRNNLVAASYECKGPAVVRYPRGCEPPLPDDFHPTYGTFDLYGDGRADILIVTYGRLFSNAAYAANVLREKGFQASVLKINRIKPIDKSCYDVALYFNRVIFFEEGILAGGIGEHFGINLYESGFKGNFRAFGIDDCFVPQGTVDELISMLRLDTAGMVKAVLHECGVI